MRDEEDGVGDGFVEIEPPPADLFQINHVPLTNEEVETIKLAA